MTLARLVGTLGAVFSLALAVIVVVAWLRERARARRDTLPAHWRRRQRQRNGKERD